MTLGEFLCTWQGIVTACLAIPGAGVLVWGLITVVMAIIEDWQGRSWRG